MKNNYILDLEKNSYTKSLTPTIAAKNMPFYIEGFGYFNANDKYYTEREGQKNYLLIYTLDGQGFLKYNGYKYNMKIGDVILFDCFNYQYYNTQKDYKWAFYFIHFNGIIAKEYYNIINKDKLNIINIRENISIINCFKEIILQKTDEDGIYRDIKNAMDLNNLISMLILEQSKSNNNTNNIYKKSILKIIQYIQNNYKEKINLDILKDMAHLSKYHFIRVFKSFTGLTPYDYILNHRINMSKNLLKNTELCINEIAEQSGFNDVNGFIRSFKIIVGTSPYKYKRYWID